MLRRLKFDLGELATKIISKLPNELFESDSTTFLDPEIGGGQFVRAVEERLRQHGHSDSNISRRVFGLTENRIRLNYIKNTYESVGTYSVGDFLTTEYNEMKFDVIIGNPPYNDSTTVQSESGLNQRKGSNLARLFLEYSLTLTKPTGYTALVLPISRVFTDKVINDLVEDGYLHLYDATPYFPKVKLGKITAMLYCKQEQGRYINEIQPYSRVDNSISKLISQTTIVDSKKGFSRKTLEEVLQDAGQYEVWVSMSKTMYTDSIDTVNEIGDKSKGYWRVAMPGLANSMKDIGKIEIVPPHITLFGTCKAFTVKSEAEALKLYDYLRSDEVLEKLYKVKTSIANSKKFFDYIENPL
tara:strand:- start:79 stop:1146 length:1068 start_codon:yes stop_codon:yes gene_type:complete